MANEYLLEPVVYNITLKQGDTFGGLTFTATETDGGAPIAVASARALVRDRSGAQVHDFAPVVGGAGSNEVTLQPIDEATSAALPLGRHAWDLEFTLATGAVRTWVKGFFKVVDDVS